jgi:dephospho-CoA kinase
MARIKVGLTGGIGSGKSLVASRLAELGAHVVDTDQIAHQLTGPSGDALDAIRAAFGERYVAADGSLDRERMRALVFTDATARAALERILHPLIRAEAERQSARPPVGAPYTLLVVPLLVESGDWHDRVDRVAVVDCAVDSQVRRVVARSGLDAAAVLRIISHQAQRAARLDAADDVIVNEGSAAMLEQRAARLHEHLCRLAHGNGPAPGDASL